MSNHNVDELDMRSIDSESAEGMKHDHGKPQWNLLPWYGMEEVVQVLTFGAKKYAPDNWRRVTDARSRYSAAALRHISAFMQGQDKDEETDLHHLAHATCCLLFLLEILQFQDEERE